jgi:hypothetical protein
MNTTQTPAAGPLDPVTGWGVDLATLSQRELDVFMAGMLSGYLEGETAGYTRGREAAEVELAAIQRAAARVVHAMARLEPHAGSTSQLHTIS